MKQIIALVLCFALAYACVGCSLHSKQDEDIRFYYCAKEPYYFDEGTVIQWEPRGGIRDLHLSEVLAFYLQGPQSADVRSPFPEGFRIVSSYMDGQTLHLTVSNELCSLTGMELTMACACLTLTCLDAISAENVVITPEDGLLDGQRSITMNKNTLLLQLGNLEGE